MSARMMGWHDTVAQSHALFAGTCGIFPTSSKIRGSPPKYGVAPRYKRDVGSAGSSALPACNASFLLTFLYLESILQIWDWAQISQKRMQ
jgi:hypothetical protein